MNGPYQKCLKRPLDMIIGALLLIALSPLLLCIAILVKVNLGRPVLFRQRRPGREGEPFFLYKFRTMTDERTTTGEMLPDSARLTRLGNFLRHSSMDELPELLNVVRGEMSLIRDAPAADGISGTLYPRPSSSALRQTRHYGMGTSQWAKRYQLGREVSV